MDRGGIIKNDLKKAPQTGNWRFMRPEIEVQKCIGCGTCVPHCPEACIELVARNKKQSEGIKNKKAKLAEIDYDWCKGCGVCAAVCPVKAIIMTKE